MARLNRTTGVALLAAVVVLAGGGLAFALSGSSPRPAPPEADVDAAASQVQQFDDQHGTAAFIGAYQDIFRKLGTQCAETPVAIAALVEDGANRERAANVTPLDTAGKLLLSLQEMTAKKTDANCTNQLDLYVGMLVNP